MSTQTTRLIGATQRRDLRLETTNGIFEADIVVNAAGPWAVSSQKCLVPPSLCSQLHGAVTVELRRSEPSRHS